ncbi:SET domain-containing protein [Coprinopsis marcescibilis]|uniref:SET domain-containing protein n=1 Tax=Coprinopsis marcescibilis TaxID=230819 RepID=A0A5C3KH55_COPMA|nr:SET domain-containing protein [Coprinopsis marcescibilis]
MMDTGRVDTREYELRATVRDIYEELLEWDRQYSTKTLQGLQCQYEPVPTLPKGKRKVSDTQKGSGSEVFSMETFDKQANTQLVADKMKMDVKFAPVPRYESCTPVSRNIVVGDDSDHMPFSPYSDDPKFAFEPYHEEHKYFEWQKRHLDPDLEMLAIETISRLHLSPEELDDIEIDGLKPQPGITRVSQRRDYPEMPQGWSGALPYNPPHVEAAPSEILRNITRYFCNNPNCLTGYCDSHSDELPDIPLSLPTVASDALNNAATDPCGEDCFLLDFSTRPINDPWDATDIELLQLLFETSPDAMPCDLSVICRKPCYQVLKRRKDYLISLDSARSDRPTKRPLPPRFNDHDPTRYTPNIPCGHDGPCNAMSDCPCWNNDAHCTLSCRCDKKCLRQRKGCTCSATRKGRKCSSTRCSCFEAHLECDPRICIGCCARDSHDPTSCRNVYIQQGLWKATEVSPTDWGLGLFLLEDADEGDMIMEYTGELIFEPTTRSRDHVVSHRGRGYLFQLNSTMSIDSSYVGNASRYINHNKNANCRANIRLVNGEHRIGVFATKPLKKGTEVLFDYGPSFFQTKGAEPQKPQKPEDQEIQEIKKKRLKRNPRGYEVDAHGVTLSHRSLDEKDVPMQMEKEGPVTEAVVDGWRTEGEGVLLVSSIASSVVSQSHARQSEG